MFQHISTAPRFFGGVAVIALSLSACASVPALDLKMGDCLDLPDDANLETGFEMSSVKIVECTEQHDAQIVGEVAVDGNDFPGSDALMAKAEEFCPKAFQEFVGIGLGESSLDLYPLTPTQDSWQKADDRSILCIAVDLSQPATKSFKGLKK